MDRIPGIVVQVEGLAGTSIEVLSRSLVALADRWGVMVECHANGIQMLACPGDTPTAVYDFYQRQLAYESRKWR